MKPIIPIKLTLEDLEDELFNIEQCLKETDDFLKIKLSKEKIKELEKLKENLELLKSFEKINQKKKHLKFLNDRKNNFDKAIKKMKKNKQTIYNPIKGEDWIDE